MKQPILKNKWYLGRIIKRFMSQKECAEFDALYQENKIVTLGQKAARK